MVLEEIDGLHELPIDKIQGQQIVDQAGAEGVSNLRFRQLDRHPAPQHLMPEGDHLAVRVVKARRIQLGELWSSSLDWRQWHTEVERPALSRGECHGVSRRAGWGRGFNFKFGRRQWMQAVVMTAQGERKPRRGLTGKDVQGAAIAQKSIALAAIGPLLAERLARQMELPNPDCLNRAAKAVVACRRLGCLLGLVAHCGCQERGSRLAAWIINCNPHKVHHRTRRLRRAERGGEDREAILDSQVSDGVGEYRQVAVFKRSHARRDGGLLRTHKKHQLAKAGVQVSFRRDFRPGGRMKDAQLVGRLAEIGEWAGLAVDLRRDHLGCQGERQEHR